MGRPFVPEDYAWLAGIIIADGSIGIQHQCGKAYGFMTVSMQDRRAMERVAEIMERKLRTYPPRGNARREAYVVSCGTNRTVELIRLMWLWLRESEKGEKAKALLDLFELTIEGKELVGPRRRSPSEALRGNTNAKGKTWKLKRPRRARV